KEHEMQIPAGIELSPDGTVYVLDAGNKKVLRFSDAMMYLSSFAVEAEGKLELADIALDPVRKLLYILDKAGERVLVYTTKGRMARTIGGDRASWKHIQKPVSLGMGPFGNVYIGSGYYNQLARYASSGAFTGKQDAELLSNGASVCATVQRVFLLESNYYQIRMFDNSFGGNARKGGSIGKAVKIQANDTYIYALDTYYHNVHKYLYNGKEESQIGDAGKEPGKFVEPVDIALDGKGSLYVLDQDLKRISIFNSKGDLTGKFENSSGNVVQMDEPIRLAASRDGKLIYVYDSDLYTIIKFSPEGNVLSHYGQKGAKEVGQFYYVDYLGVDESGCLVVAEPRYNRLQKVDFRGAGGKPYIQFYQDTALSKNANLFAVSPCGILVIYEKGNRLVLFD
ncbi:NHL repeat-containing protein, partial [Planctomycetota bacterium]